DHSPVPDLRRRELARAHRARTGTDPPPEDQGRALAALARRVDHAVRDEPLDLALGRAGAPARHRLRAGAAAHGRPPALPGADPLPHGRRLDPHAAEPPPSAGDGAPPRADRIRDRRTIPLAGLALRDWVVGIGREVGLAGER